MWKKFIMQYLTLSKKDRYAIAVLLCLYTIVIVVPRLLPTPPVDDDTDHSDLINEVVAAFDDSSSAADLELPNDVNPGNESPRFALFYFDPNTATTEQWIRLGVPARTAATIKNYLSKGGKFRKPEDILKIYTMDKNLAARLVPYIRIPESPRAQSSVTEERSFEPAKPETPRNVKRYTIINISTADTTELKTLPGIGSGLAGRIVTFRSRLGGFVSADQIAEVRYLHDSVYLKIRPFLVVDSSAVKKINLNSSSVETLGRHPYIGFAIANAIVRYREQHGSFKNVSDLTLLHSISPEKFEQIKLYLSVDE